MKSPVISVIMSVYNDAAFIQNSLVSLLIQTFKDFEIIVIDDGSTDDTEKQIRKLNDPRIRLINRPNTGLTKSLNYALSMAKGKWVARQDADDVSIFNRFELQMAYLRKHPDVKLLGSSQFVIRKFDLVEEIIYYPCEDDKIRSALDFFNPFVHGSMIIETQLLKQNGGYNDRYRYVQDYELWTRLVPQTTVQNLFDPLYIRCVHENCSEVRLDKKSIFQEIQATYLNNKDTQHGLYSYDSTAVKTKSIYPIISFADRHSQLLARHYWHMYKGLKQYGLPSNRALFNSFFYCPFVNLFL